MNDLVLVTGAAGRLGGFATAALAAAGYRLRLLDLHEPEDVPEGAEVLVGTVTDPALMDRATEGATALLHYGGHPRERTWEQILEVNIDGTRTVLEAARHAGVAKVYLASSNHAAGFQTRDRAPETGLEPTCPALADSYYGVSKVTTEALGAVYHHRFGIDVLAVRIGSCDEHPADERSLTTWFSRADHDAMILAWLADPTPAYRIVWGISDNRRGWFDLSGTSIPGYEPTGDSERDLPDLVKQFPPRDTPSDDLVLSRLGGSFTTVELGEFMP